METLTLDATWLGENAGELLVTLHDEHRGNQSITVPRLAVLDLVELLREKAQS